MGEYNTGDLSPEEMDYQMGGVSGFGAQGGMSGSMGGSGFLQQPGQFGAPQQGGMGGSGFLQQHGQFGAPTGFPQSQQPGQFGAPTANPYGGATANPYGGATANPYGVAPPGINPFGGGGNPGAGGGNMGGGGGARTPAPLAGGAAWTASDGIGISGNTQWAVPATNEYRALITRNAFAAGDCGPRTFREGVMGFATAADRATLRGLRWPGGGGRRKKTRRRRQRRNKKTRRRRQRRNKKTKRRR